MEQDKFALRASQAGMRFIAQMHIYNGGDEMRLTQFIADSYHADQLAALPVAARLADLQQMRSEAGRVKVKQVMATNEHHVIVIVAAEQDDRLYYMEMRVEEEYPHRITQFMKAPLKAIES